LPVLGSFDALDGIDTSNLYAICGVGSPAIKKRLTAKASARGLHFCSAFHPAAVRTGLIEWGQGVVVTAQCAFTNHIRVADHVFFNLGCTIGHDAVIGRYLERAEGGGSVW
jgi:acetyltransferase-like isoleucine patch superfamily enzyme